MSASKNLSFSHRARHAWAGVGHAFKTETSFRTHVVGTLAAVALLLVLRPEPIWWALVLLTSGAVIAAELFNTALELVMDRLHPDVHPMIGRAKDCAAGAVLILSLVSLAIATALIVETCKS